MSLPTNQLDIVKFILERSPEARDSDNILLWIVWKKAFPIIDTDIEAFKELFLSKKLPSMESITRARRKLQADFPNLRGFRYDERQNNQDKYKEDLGYTEIIKREQLNLDL